MVERIRAEGVPGDGRDVRWVRLDGLHLTLRFLGPTLEEGVALARDAVIEAAGEHGPIAVALGGAGTFPTGGRPRALWLGVREGVDELTDLAGTVDRALVGRGWPAETRPFRAHLTLARADGVPAGAAIGARLEAAAAGLSVAFELDRIGLFESLTGGGPARYEPLEVAALGGSRQPG